MPLFHEPALIRIRPLWMASLKKSLTEHPARPEEAQAQAQAQEEAQAQEDAQEEAQEEWLLDRPDTRPDERPDLTGTGITFTLI